MSTMTILRRRAWSAALALAFLACGACTTNPVTAVPAPLPPQAPVKFGVLQERSLAADPKQAYYLYVPRRGGRDAPIFVSVHGISRNVEEHATLFAPFAERYGVVLVAPYFPSDRYPDYQRLDRSGRGPRADMTLNRIVAEVGQLTGARSDRLYLFGYSGGAQFVHRYTLAHPERVAKLVIGAAGWYTMPYPNLRYPAGIKPSPKLPGVTFDPQKFLTVPTCVLVGEMDTRRDPHLRKGIHVDTREGDTRLIRGQRWVEAMRRAAHHYGMHTEFDFRVLPYAAHSFADSMKLGGMGTDVFHFLFGNAPGESDVHAESAAASGKGRGG